MRQILVEGHDGCGKTSFSHLLVDNYRERGFTVDRLKFPTTYPDDDLLSRLTDLMMFYLNDFREGLLPYRENPVDILVIDRSFLSTIVYQCFFQKGMRDILDENAMRSIASLGSRIFTEGLGEVEVEVVFLECDLNIAMQRITSRAAEVKDLLERMSIKDRYRKISRLKDRYEVVKSVLKYGWFHPLKIGGNAFDEVRTIDIDTTHISPKDVLSEYLRRSFEPENFGINT